MKRTLSLFVIVISLTFWGCKEKVEKTVPKEVPVLEEVEVIPETPKEEVVVVQEPEPVVIRGVTLSDRYFIIAGSYNIYGNAELLSKQLQKMEYKPVILMQDENGQFKVAIESFQSLKQAENEMAKLMEDKAILKHCWIFKRKGEVKAFTKDPH